MLGNCVLASAVVVNETDLGTDALRVVMTPSVSTSVGSCVLATFDSVLGDETVVGTDVDRVDTESDKECLVISD